MVFAMRRIRWCDARTLRNGLPWQLAVYLGVACSPSLHLSLSRCTFHRLKGWRES
jgi:hypothetical protein